MQCSSRKTRAGDGYSKTVDRWSDSEFKIRSAWNFLLFCRAFRAAVVSLAPSGPRKLLRCLHSAFATNQRFSFFGQDRCKGYRSVEERRCYFVATILAKSNLDDVCKREAIEHGADGVSDVEHQHSQATVHFVRAGAACIGCGTDAPDRCQRPIDQPNDGSKLYLAHGTRKRVPAKLPAPAFHITGGFKLRKNLLQEFDW